MGTTTYPHVRVEDSRTKGNIKHIRHVYPNLKRKGNKTLMAIRNSPAAPPTNFAFDTFSGKHQVVWKVAGMTQDEAESLLRNLANQFGGDLAVTDSARMLGLPGFAKRKLPEEFIVQARQESEVVHTLRDDTTEKLQHLGRAGEGNRTVPSDPKSQSGHDWAYAKGMLARGDDPEIVIQGIADYLVEDKSDLKYYARYKGMKAPAQLEGERGNCSRSEVSDARLVSER